MLKEKFDVLDLMNKPKNERFTEEEKEFLRKKYPRKQSKIRYGIWKNEQRNGHQIVVLTQFARIPGRKPGLDNSIEFIAEEPLSKKEYEEYIENFGCTSRVYLMYRYTNVEQVMREDANCGYETPQKFINECRRRDLTEAPNLFTDLDE